MIWATSGYPASHDLQGGNPGKNAACDSVCFALRTLTSDTGPAMPQEETI